MLLYLFAKPTYPFIMPLLFEPGRSMLPAAKAHCRTFSQLCRVDGLLADLAISDTRSLLYTPYPLAHKIIAPSRLIICSTSCKSLLSFLARLYACVFCV